ncbi:MAG: M56 family metallopeptidase, partial [Wenzhouxiangellaceae bacterium]
MTDAVLSIMLQIVPGLSLVLAAILLLRPWVLARLGAPAAYRLWVLVPLWLAAAMPAVVWPAFMAAWLPVSGTAILLEAVRATALAGPAAGETTEALPAALLVGTFWLIGVAAMLAMLAHRWIGAARLLQDARPAPAQLSEQVPGVAHRAIGISDRLTGPTVVGIRQPRILLPADFGERFDPETLTLILRHEAVHLGRRDNLANLLAELLLALMWFNPLAWLARRAFRTDQELSCDSRALAESAGPGRIAYARSLLDLSTSSRSGPDSRALACPWHSMSTLKRRIKMIDIHHPGHFRRLPGLVLLAALAGAAVFVLPVAGA